MKKSSVLLIFSIALTVIISGCGTGDAAVNMNEVENAEAVAATVNEVESTEAAVAKMDVAENAYVNVAYDYTRDLVYIEQEDMSLGDIKLGISEEVFDSLVTSELLGETVNDAYEPEYLAKERVYSDGLTAVIADFHDGWEYVLLSLGTTSTKYETARGLKVGDDIGKMHELYGEEVMKINDTAYYTTKSGDHFQLTISVQDDKITKIGMSLLTGASLCGCSDGVINPAYFMTYEVKHDN